MELELAMDRISGSEECGCNRAELLPEGGSVKNCAASLGNTVIIFAERGQFGYSSWPHQAISLSWNRPRM